MSVDRKHLSIVSPAAEGLPEEADLESAVCNALACAGKLDASYIFVTARGSDITLAGWVHVNEEISRAEEIAVRIKGVRKVHNELSRDL
jgi:osmotically-inducible protein OsmY